MEKSENWDHGVSTSPKHSPLRNTKFSLNHTSAHVSSDDELETFWNSCTEEPKHKRAKTSAPLKKAQHVENAERLCFTTSYEIDTLSNPYLEVPQPITGQSKVTFIDFRDGINVHEYSLQDERGGYIKYLTSVSALLDTWFVWNKQDNQDETLDDIEPRLKRAHDAHKASKQTQSGARFDASIPVISQIFTDYFNNFCDGQVDIPSGRVALSFNQRRDYFLRIQDSKSPKNVDQFFPSKLFCDFEQWFKAGCPSFTPFQEQSHAFNLARYVFNPQFPNFEQIEHARLRHVFKAFLSADEFFAPMTGSDLVTSYEVGRESGTALHNYLEFRLTDPMTNTAEAAKLKFPLREEDDYIQTEDFIINCPFSFVYLERRLASFRHKICGSVDAIRQLPDGTYVIHDHKRTPKFNERPWFKTKNAMRRPILSDEAPSGDLIKFAIQMAGYRKLLILNGTLVEPIKVSNLAYLHVFHPSLRNWALVEIDMEQKMRTDNRGYFKGLGMEEFGEASKTLSPIELVEILFQFYEREVSQILRKRV